MGGIIHITKQEVVTVPTRMHSSRMRTTRTLTVSPSMLCAGGVSAPRGCTWSEGVSAPGGGECVCFRGGVCSQGVYLVLGGVPGPGGCTWSGGVYLVPEGVCSGGCTCSQGVYLVRYSPPWTDTRL